MCCWSEGEIQTRPGAVGDVHAPYDRPLGCAADAVAVGEDPVLLAGCTALASGQRPDEVVGRIPAGAVANGVPVRGEALHSAGAAVISRPDAHRYPGRVNLVAAVGDGAVEIPGVPAQGMTDRQPHVMDADRAGGYRIPLVAGFAIT